MIVLVLEFERGPGRTVLISLGDDVGDDEPICEWTFDSLSTAQAFARDARPRIARRETLIGRSDREGLLRELDDVAKAHGGYQRQQQRGAMA
jgi:hypothetical protein